MEIADLKVGDVVLFSAEEGSFISWAITFLTDAPVSHAALFYGDYQAQPSLIEETPPAVAINPAAERFVGRTITVRRLDSSLPLDPVIAAAQNYYNNTEPYDNAGLYMVGMLLIYKKFTPDTLKQKIIIKILKKLITTLDAYINNHKYPGKTPMVCSQFDTQCYDDAGPQYQLQFSGNVLYQAAGASLLDQAITLVESDKERFANYLNAPLVRMLEEPTETAEQLCAELKDAFEQGQSLTAAVTLDPDLVVAIQQFAEVNSQYLAGEVRLTSAAADITTPLQLLKTNENMFISPGDLLLHCTNLKDVGTITS